MAGSTYTLRSFARVLREYPGLTEDKAIAALRELAAEMVPVVVEKLRSKGIDDTGQLRQSVRAYPLRDGGMVKADAPHARIVELGSRPHWPPQQPIEDWVRRKIRGSDDEIEEMTYKVRFKIAREGTKPRHYMRAAVQEMNRRLPNAVARAVARVL